MDNNIIAIPILRKSYIFEGSNFILHIELVKQCKRDVFTKYTLTGDRGYVSISVKEGNVFHIHSEDADSWFRILYKDYKKIG